MTTAINRSAADVHGLADLVAAPDRNLTAVYITQ
jgi:hypothetical protein